MPAIVLIILGAGRAPAATLAQVAMNESLRRLATPPAELHLSTIDIPPPFPMPLKPGEPSMSVKLGDDPAEAAREAADKATAAERGDEAFWRAKMTAARAALEQDEVLHDAMQSRINALVTDFASRDDPAQRAEIERQRIRALDELDRLKKQVQKDKDTISEIEEDARKKGIPPGWIR